MNGDVNGEGREGSRLNWQALTSVPRSSRRHRQAPACRCLWRQHASFPTFLAPERTCAGLPAFSCICIRFLSISVSYRYTTPVVGWHLGAGQRIKEACGSVIDGRVRLSLDITYSLISTGMEFIIPGHTLLLFLANSKYRREVWLMMTTMTTTLAHYLLPHITSPFDAVRPQKHVFLGIENLQ